MSRLGRCVCVFTLSAAASLLSAQQFNGEFSANGEVVATGQLPAKEAYRAAGRDVMQTAKQGIQSGFAKFKGAMAKGLGKVRFSEEEVVVSSITALSAECGEALQKFAMPAR